MKSKPYQHLGTIQFDDLYIDNETGEYPNIRQSIQKLSKKVRFKKMHKSLRNREARGRGAYEGSDRSEHWKRRQV